MKYTRKIAFLAAGLLFAGLAGGFSASKEAYAAETTQNKTTETSASKGDINKKAILVVSFGTSYHDTREKTIGAIEKDIQAAYPTFELRRAFTSQMIIKKLKERDNLAIDTVEEAMDRLVREGYGMVICQPTHVMHGYEYDEMVAAMEPYKEKIQIIAYGEPLLSSNADYQSVVAAIKGEFPNLKEDEAVVLVGHGTEHFANADYAALAYRFQAENAKNILVGTVEAFPDMAVIIKSLQEQRPSKVYLMPFMIVAGDHAVNDIASDEEGSWKMEIEKAGFPTEALLKGLGEIKGIRQIYVNHVGAAIQAASAAK